MSTQRKLLTACLAIVVVTSMFGGGIAYGQPTDGVSTHDSAVGDSALHTQIDPALQNQSGTVEALIRLSDGDKTLSPPDDSDTAVGTSKAISTLDQPLHDFADSNPGITIVKTFWIADAVLVEVDQSITDIEELAGVENVAGLYDNADVDPLEPEKNFTEAEPADIGEDATYGLEQINAPEVWNQLGTQGEGVKIAVLDTGIDPQHQDIDLYTDDANNPEYPGGWAEFAENGERINSQPYDQDGHGTHVSGTVAGGSDSGTHIGVAPEADLIHGGVLTPQGGTLAAVLAGMEWAVEEDARVVSMSLGVNQYEPVFIDAVQGAEEFDTTVVAAIGNSGEGTSGSPGNVYDTFSVGASNPNEQIADFSSGEEINTDRAWGNEAPADWPDQYVVPDTAAPGVEVVSAVPGGDYAAFSGTSMAAPHVSGTVALMLATTDRSVSEIKNHLSETASKPASAPEAKDPRYGHGIIDAYEATAIEGDTATVSLPDRTVEPGSTVEGSLETDATNITGHATTINFDPDVVQFDAASAGDVGEPAVNVDNENGEVSLTSAQIEAVDNPELATLTYTVVGEVGDRSPLAIDNGESAIVDEAGEDVLFATDHGSITVAENPATLSLSETTAEPGSTVVTTLESDADDLAGYVTAVEYDPDVVTFDRATGVDMADPTVNVDPDAGTIVMTSADAEGVNSPTLAELRFEVVGELGAETPLTFVDDSTELVDSKSEPLQPDYDRGHITVGNDGGGDDDLPTGEAIADLSPDDADVNVDGTTTLDLVVRGADNGVGAYSATINVDDPSIVELSDIELTDDPTFGNVSIDADGESAHIEAAMGDEAHAPGDVTIATVVIDGITEGTTSIDISDVAVAAQDEQQYNITEQSSSTITAAVAECPTVPVTGDNPPQDVTGDGLCEDIDGDGEFDIFDVQTLYNNLESDAVQDHPEAFNFAGDDNPDDVTIFDVQALFNEL